jgi:hypothetical protein
VDGTRFYKWHPRVAGSLKADHEQTTANRDPTFSATSMSDGEESELANQTAMNA